ncbi:hypothetical protein WH47_12041 [Habropoda laboriosa]|uniref:Uncharacterized protein n=1 Tax=Habropoda laboriosa TaxID=597456 RepID=A0A0L7R160_9HYME|nr:hypothetical protein WH47_12041 [Habropoda laboriosa]
MLNRNDINIQSIKYYEITTDNPTRTNKQEETLCIVAITYTFSAIQGHQVHIYVRKVYSIREDVDLIFSQGTVFQLFFYPERQC